MIMAAKRLRSAANSLVFDRPAAYVYNPLDYAWAAHERYLRQYASTTRQIVIIGMNPGPFGMVQTAVPFGEVTAVRDWLGIQARIGKPAREHPKRPVDGFACTRSEVSGTRLWGLMRARFKTPVRFFHRHFVANYCPLAFIESSGRNLTPDKLPRRQLAPLLEVCDEHLRAIVAALQPKWVIGAGGFAAERARSLFSASGPRVGQILHPSPASPAANRDWAGAVTRQMMQLGAWKA